jgi:hypothetical protein
MWEPFGPPPVLSSENPEAYYALRTGYVDYYRPANIVHLSWISELVNTHWEILRQLRYRTAAIESYYQDRMYWCRKKAEQIVRNRKDELGKLHLPFGDLGHEQVTSLQKGIATLEAKIKELAQRKPNDADHSRALEQAAKYVEKLDKWLKNVVACALRRQGLTVARVENKGCYASALIEPALRSAMAKCHYFALTKIEC